jgi:hypothetical protein
MHSRLVYLLFPLGILTGYFIPRSETKNHSSSDKDTFASHDNRPNRPRNSARSLEDARIRSLADEIANRNRANRQDKKTIVIADIPAVITHLLSLAGPSGLSWEARSEIDDMLANWAKEDFNSAFAWASAYPNRNAAKDFLEAIFKEHAKTDFDDTLKLIHKLKDESGMKLDLGSELFEIASKRSVQDAFNALAASPSDGSGFSGGSAEFPEGFDFKTFAELTSAHLKKEGKSAYSAFSHFPTNVLEDWAKVDNSAALEFYLSNENMPFNDLGEITGTFLNIAKPESTYPWLAEQYANLEGAQRSKFGGELDSVFPDEMGITPLVELVQSLPNQTLRTEMISDMLKGFGGSVRGNDPMYIDLLQLLPTPEERLNAIKTNPSLLYPLGKVSDEKIREFGITREQLNKLTGEDE